MSSHSPVQPTPRSRLLMQISAQAPTQVHSPLMPPLAQALAPSPPAQAMTTSPRVEAQTPSTLATALTLSASHNRISRPPHPLTEATRQTPSSLRPQHRLLTLTSQSSAISRPFNSPVLPPLFLAQTPLTLASQPWSLAMAIHPSPSITPSVLPLMHRR